jgi:hypothetical protein
MEKENYHFEVSVRINGKIPQNRRGNNIPRIQFQKILPIKNLENHMKHIFEEYEAITPKDADINVEAYIKNNISDTYMNMASFYGSEYRFIKH